jgi:hypothetical protein
MMIGALLFAFTLAGPSNPNGASITKDFGCNGFVPNADGTQGPFFFTENKSQSVITPSGNTKVICHFDIPAGLSPRKATHAKNFLCNTFLGVTSDSSMVANPGGKATLTCSIKALALASA